MIILIEDSIGDEIGLISYTAPGLMDDTLSWTYGLNHLIIQEKGMEHLP